MKGGYRLVDEDVVKIEPDISTYDFIEDLLEWDMTSVFGKALDALAMAFMDHLEVIDTISNYNVKFVRGARTRYNLYDESHSGFAFVDNMIKYAEDTFNHSVNYVNRIFSLVMSIVAVITPCLIIIGWLTGYAKNLCRAGGRTAGIKAKRLGFWLYYTIRTWLHRLGE